jgi:hypothetical protein
VEKISTKTQEKTPCFGDFVGSIFTSLGKADQSGKLPPQVNKLHVIKDNLLESLLP